MLANPNSRVYKHFDSPIISCIPTSDDAQQIEPSSEVVIEVKKLKFWLKAHGIDSLWPPFIEQIMKFGPEHTRIHFCPWRVITVQDSGSWLPISPNSLMFIALSYWGKTENNPVVDKSAKPMLDLSFEFWKMTVSRISSLQIEVWRMRFEKTSYWKKLV